MRRTNGIRLLLIVFFALKLIAAQSTNGIISGIVFDPTGKAIPGAEILMVNDATGISYPGVTNGEGIYTVPDLPPGPYRIQVSKFGFKTMIKPDIVLHAEDALSINFTLPLGATSEVVTVESGTPLINTTNASVGTVVDRKFVENLPLNGRSFNTLLQLTPGVVIAGTGGNVTSPGQFSIAGQRTDANNFSVDGVSANFGVVAAPSPGASGTGSAQAFSALGGTSSLVSVEALQEFRVETSSFAPEFGSSSGGQVILTTRAGTNEFHGGIYEYFRNDVMDANDWFASAAGAKRAPERHNDFGGFLGGPLRTSKTFFFFSYEGARLRLPQTSVINVPSSEARSGAPAAVQPYFDVYPLPNGPIGEDGSTAQFTGTYSNQASLNATSIRIDHKFGDKFSLFARYNDAPSSTVNRRYALTTLASTEVDTHTATAGLNMAFSSTIANSVRGNYSRQSASQGDAYSAFGGAGAVVPAAFMGEIPLAGNSVFFTLEDAATFALGQIVMNRTNQANIVDDLTVIAGRHRLQFGGDYRAIFLDGSPARYELFYTVAHVQDLATTATASLSVSATSPARLLAQTLSAYAQDTWKLSPRFTVTYGLRWELSPAPEALGKTQLAAWNNVEDPSQITLAPPDSPVWKTSFRNFAPRLGLAYKLTQSGDLVLRAGAGIFYDLGLGSSAGLTTSFPNLAFLYSPTVGLPPGNLSPYLPPAPSLAPPFPDGVYGFARDLSLPRSYQWNVALEKSFVPMQSLLVTYVGQAGRGLLRQEALTQPNKDFLGDFIVTGNSAWSNYNALEIQYRLPLTNGVQTLLSYSLSHSLDNASNDIVSGLSNTVISAANDYAPSTFDVRQSFSGALTFGIPAVSRSGALGFLTRNWSLDGIVVARTGFPFNGIVYLASPDPSGNALSRPDHVAGQPYWIANPTAGGGKSLNPLAFSVPTTPRQGTEGRDDIRGFSLTQPDLSLARKFPIRDRWQLQFRADAFNAFNHPNFANPEALVEFGPYFRKSNSMLNQALGGLNPLFQEGGPRSLQLSLKLTY